jgi:hypothetical protein
VAIGHRRMGHLTDSVNSPPARRANSSQVRSESPWKDKTPPRAQGSRRDDDRHPIKESLVAAMALPVPPAQWLRLAVILNGDSCWWDGIANVIATEILHQPLQLAVISAVHCILR